MAATKTDPPSPDDKDPVDSQSSASPEHSTEIRKTVDSQAQKMQNTDHSRAELNARLDRVLAHYHKISNGNHPSIKLDATLDQILNHSQKCTAPVHIETNKSVITPAQGDQDAALAGAHEVSARIDSKAGLMAVIAWACGCQRCRITG